MVRNVETFPVSKDTSRWSNVNSKSSKSKALVTPVRTGGNFAPVSIEFTLHRTQIAVLCAADEQYTTNWMELKITARYSRSTARIGEKGKKIDSRGSREKEIAREGAKKKKKRCTHVGT